MHPIYPTEGVASRTMYRFNDIDPTKTALIVVDMQVAFTRPGQPGTGPYAASLIPAINKLAQAVRAAGGLVAFTRHTMTREGPRAIPEWQFDAPELALLEPLCQVGRAEHAIDPEIHQDPSDLIVDKYRYSALTYNSSDLKAHLEHADIDTVVVTGVIANCCCESTARDASMLGYRTFFVSDGTAALSDEEHNAALLSMRTIFADVRSTDELLTLVRACDRHRRAHAAAIG
ncbi:isochorismatase family protein [Sphingomonas oryzagri]